ncbi:hypothetical protein Tco_1195974, partial [Tanacetum coccineum]
PIVLDIPTDLPSTPELPAFSPFLCSNDSEFEPADELPERHVLLRLYDDVVFRWRDRVRFHPSSPSGSSSPDTTIPSAKIPTIAKKTTLGLRPSMTPTRSAALHRARQATLSLETSSSDTSSGSSSDSASHTSGSSFTTSLQGIQISLEDHLHHSSKAIRSPSRPLT